MSRARAIDGGMRCWLRVHEIHGHVVQVGCFFRTCGAFVRHPDGTESWLGDGTAEQIKARAENAIEIWREQNP